MRNLNTRIAFVLIVMVAAFSLTGQSFAQDSEGDGAKAEIAERTLNEQLLEIKAGFTPPPEVIEIIGRAMQDLRDANIVENAVQSGDEAPDFTLPDAGGNKVTLSDLLKSGPVVLLYVRGGW